jgi:hypothetical protein
MVRAGGVEWGMDVYGVVEGHGCNVARDRFDSDLMVHFRGPLYFAHRRREDKSCYGHCES